VLKISFAVFSVKKYYSIAHNAVLILRLCTMCNDDFNISNVLSQHG